MVFLVDVKKCNRRRTFTHHPESYSKRFKFLFCCGRIDWRIDKYRLKTENKVNKCLCDGYWFPHRIGSKFCIHFKGELTDLEQMERYENTKF